MHSNIKYRVTKTKNSKHYLDRPEKRNPLVNSYEMMTFLKNTSLAQLGNFRLDSLRSICPRGSLVGKFILCGKLGPGRLLERTSDGAGGPVHVLQ